MSSGVLVITLVAALGCGLAAGFFFAFSTCVMPALGRLPAPQAAAAMQTINVVVINPVFMTVLFGTALACLASIVGALADWDAAYGPYLLAGGTVYLLGTIGVTMLANVPRNNALARLDPASAELESRWARYLAEWTAWNHVRTGLADRARARDRSALRQLIAPTRLTWPARAALYPYVNDCSDNRREPWSWLRERTPAGKHGSQGDRRGPHRRVR
jgi:uncharacterized membrane protein